MQAYVPPGIGFWSMPGVHQVTALTAFMLLKTALPQPTMHYDGVYSYGSLAENHLTSLPSLHCAEGLLFSGLVLPIDTVDSKLVMGVEPGDFSVLIR